MKRVAPLPVFWVVRKHGGERSVFLQPASAAVYGWLRSAIAGHQGTMAEIHELDAETARRIPRDMIGRVLSREETVKLLELIG